MTPDRPWPADLTQVIGRQVRRYRDEHGMSASALAAAVAKLLGGEDKYTRSQVTNLEANRRTSITISEVIAFAAVLGVPPIVLMFPIGRGSVELLPGRRVDAWAAFSWFADRGLYGGLTSDIAENLDEPELTVAAFRALDAAVVVAAVEHPDVMARQEEHDGIDMRDEHDVEIRRQRYEARIETVVARRDHLRALKLTPPPLPDEIREDVERVERKTSR